MKKAILVMAYVANLFAWEVNTHRAIDRQAVKYSSNFQNFLQNAGVKNRSYQGSSINFDGYHKTYTDYVVEGENDGISQWSQTFNKYSATPQDLIEAGAILEDAVYEKAPFAFNGRFNNHFYDAQNGGHALTFGYGLRVNALEWGANGAHVGAFVRNNRYSYQNALNYFKLGFTSSSPAERRKYQAKMFVTLGHLLHLMNDMTSPAHTRDDSHPLGDPLEVWGRGGDDGKQYTGYRITGNSLNNYAGIAENKATNMPKYSGFSDFITKEASWTSTHFFSKDTMYTKPRPSLGDTYETFAGSRSTFDKYYIRSHGTGTSECSNGCVPYGTKLGIRIKSYIINALGERYYTGTSNVLLDKTTSFRGDYTVLKENAQVLIPRAIANARNFLDWFFRGQIEAKIDGRNITIKNISNPSLAKDSHAVTLAPGRFYIKYYHTGNFPGTREETLRDFVFTLDFKRYTQNIELIGTFSEAFPPVYTNGFSSLVALGPGESIVVPIKKDTSIIHKDIEVVYDGFIGGERGFAICFMSKPTMMSE